MDITLKKTHLQFDNYQTFHMVHKAIPLIWNHDVNITNFIKIKNHFNHFLKYMQFLVGYNTIFFCTNVF